MDQHNRDLCRRGDLQGTCQRIPIQWCEDDAAHALANEILDDLDLLDPQRIYLVQLSDFMWQETPTFEERATSGFAPYRLPSKR